MERMTPTLRDLWRAPRLGAGLKKIVVAGQALLLAWFGQALLGYAAYRVAGRSSAQIWQETGFLFPLPSALRLGGAGTLLAVAGLGGALWILLVGGTAVAKITCRELKGDDFYGGSDAWRYARRHAGTVVGTPLLLAAMVVLTGGGSWLLIQVARIPGAGPSLLGLVSFPALLLALAAVGTIVALLVSLLLSPAMVGSTGEDAVEGVLQTFGLLWLLPGRTAGYLLTAIVTTLLTLTATGLPAGLAVLAGARAAAAALGSQWPAFAVGVGALLPPWCREGVGTLLPATGAWVSTGAPATAVGFGPLLTGLALLLIGTGVLACGMATLTAGITTGWVALRHTKDGENLLEWLDEVDELEERPMASEAPALRSGPA